MESFYLSILSFLENSLKCLLQRIELFVEDDDEKKDEQCRKILTDVVARYDPEFSKIKWKIYAKKIDERLDGVQQAGKKVIFRNRHDGTSGYRLFIEAIVNDNEMGSLLHKLLQ
eukprot:121565_1